MSASNWAICPNCDGDFREDYEIFGAETGTVEVTYRGGCRTCGVELTFEHFHNVDKKPGVKPAKKHDLEALADRVFALEARVAALSDETPTPATVERVPADLVAVFAKALEDEFVDTFGRSTLTELADAVLATPEMKSIRAFMRYACDCNTILPVGFDGYMRAIPDSVYAWVLP